MSHNRDNILLRAVGDVLRERLEAVQNGHSDAPPLDPMLRAVGDVLREQLTKVKGNIESVALSVDEQLSQIKPLLETPAPSPAPIVQINMEPIAQALERIEKLLTQLVERKPAPREPRTVEITNQDGSKSYIKGI